MSTLAAARADNFYYPPEWTPEQGSLNKFQGQHPLRERARKIGQGILIIRFEMPFNIWCGGCGAMIAKGVRFNAEKKQVGNYLSTKIWSFKMKSACCHHEIEVHTDPKNCEYVIVSGAERKVEEFSAEDAETMSLPTAEEKEQLEDSFFRVEHVAGDRRKAAEAAPLIARLKRESDAKHSDSWRLNRALRDKLRAQKKRVEEEKTEARRLGLSIRLLPPSPEDAAAAATAAFRSKFDANRREKRASICASSIFSSTPATTSSTSHGFSAGASTGSEGNHHFAARQLRKQEEERKHREILLQKRRILSQ
eukprot:TRINITY_DN15162_c0_g2_i5.p1 TRINITY_DN15162_c0_g2~~TRINITY_DN15162_c0_g2_i5.p1  ORF type:complete len:308 (-),score=109.57 TRINITY_DN15162_c0_g2_i5:155-1078(-)